MKLAILSANLGVGGYDAPHPWPDLVVPPGMELSIHRLTDENFPPRSLAMTSRLQCGIPKWFGADFVPDADRILWIDASCVPTPEAVPWFLDKLGAAEIAVFRHPDRATVKAEYAFMKQRMAQPGERYLTSRYHGEWLDGQFERLRQLGADMLPLYASTAFVYRPTARMTEALAECFLWKARWLLHDQLAFSYVLHKHDCRVNVISDNYLKCPALTFVRVGRMRH